jgi:flagellar basal-body rod modification protein FlgD
MSSVQGWAPISASGSEPQTKPVETSSGDVATKDTFLKLLVAQLKNQNPLSPTDGTQFLTQLAQFTQLEQTMGMHQDLSAIREAVQKPATTATEGK